jgi:DNA topoisomerase II
MATQLYPKATDYNKSSLDNHIYHNPDTYLKSDAQVKRKTLVYDFSSQRITYSTITLPHAVERLFIEITSNAGDNVNRSLEWKYKDIPPIEVNIDKTIITVRNGGVPIPVEKHPEYDVWVPELIFGHTLSSNNYNFVDGDKHADRGITRTGIGKNGLGSKATNIFSNRFEIKLGDEYRQLSYQQCWTNNKKDVTEPVVRSYKGKSYVEVSYELDFERFNYHHYPSEAPGLFVRHCAEIAYFYHIEVKVKVKGKKLLCFNFQDSLDYAKLFFHELPKHHHVNSKNFDCILLDTPDEAVIHTLVNGMNTDSNGIHLDAVYKQLQKIILMPLNKGNSRANKLGVNDLRDHISIILAIKVSDPQFGGQSKDKLESGQLPRFSLSNCKFDGWDLIPRLMAAKQSKELKVLQKTDGVKKGRIDVPKLVDAHHAGKRSSRKCSLFITEGSSAQTYATSYINFMDNGRDYHGAYPLNGKPMNVKEHSNAQIAKSEKLKNLKKALGLKEGRDYHQEANMKTLRYGHVVIMVDADPDGKHIASLLINYFHRTAPSLLERGDFLAIIRLPLLRVYKGKQSRAFYSMTEYNTWKNRVKDLSSWTHKYFKGLGSSSDDDIREDIQNPHIVSFVYDDSATVWIEKMFSREKVNERKEWLQELEEYIPDLTHEIVPVSDFIHQEVVEYCQLSINRAIPSMIDGLKDSQRKIIWTSLQKWHTSIYGNKACQSMKVGQLSSSTAEKTSYAHGEENLSRTIIKLGQGYTGSNNMPYFIAEGQLGNREHNGKNYAKPRYAHVRPQWWWKYIYPVDDEPLLERVVEEGENREPKHLLPIIPMVLVNGASGLAEGFSTNILNHNPVSIVNWFKDRLQGKQSKSVIEPWYKGFLGELIVMDHDQYQAWKEGILAVDTYVEQEDEAPPEAPQYSSYSQEKRQVLISKGVYRKINQNTVIVTEIPLGVSYHQYEDILNNMIDKKIIKDFRRLTKNGVVSFEIKGIYNPSHVKLKLLSELSLNNYTVLDEHKRPCTYHHVKELLKDFYKLRLKGYQERQEHLLSTVSAQIEVIDDKIKIISFIRDSKLDLFHLSRQQVKEELEQEAISTEHLAQISLNHCTLDGMNKLIEHREKLVKQLEELKQMEPKQMWLKDLDDFLRVYQRRNR